MTEPSIWTGRLVVANDLLIIPFGFEILKLAISFSE